MLVGGGPRAGLPGQFLKGQGSEASLQVASCPGSTWGASCQASVASAAWPASPPPPPPTWPLLGMPSPPLPGGFCPPRPQPPSPRGRVGPGVLILPCWAAVQSQEACPVLLPGEQPGASQPRA